MQTANQKHTSLIGVASCWGAPDHRCALGPETLRSLRIEERLNRSDRRADWLTMIRPSPQTPQKTLELIVDVCTRLAAVVQQQVQAKQSFAVLGGDHSCAIGTWSGAQAALAANDRLGLIWIDAHMDAHIPETSPSGAIHGMPLACLLGHGEKQLRMIGGPQPKLSPADVLLIGVRSFERGEATLLNMLGVKVYFMEEVQQRGLAAVMNEAVGRLDRHCTHIGLTLDLDAMDPEDAPGVGSPAADGLRADELLAALNTISANPKLIGVEITEFNPANDINDRTAELTYKLLNTLLQGLPA